MDPRRLSELVPFLKENGLFPKRSLSQNFLIDPNILKKIVKSAHLLPNDSVLEIGPGPGGLTKTLIEEGAHVTAVEIDKRFANLLSQTISSENLTVICTDFLDFTPITPCTVIANIPYHISSPILYKLTDHIQLFSKIFLTVQKDFTERIFAKKPTNPLALFIEFFFIAKVEFTIGKNCFYPKPNVDSALLSLIPRKTFLLPDPKPFFTFVRFLFQKRRKMIRSILNLPDVTAERPEALKLQDLVDLYLSLQAQNRLPQLQVAAAEE